MKHNARVRPVIYRPLLVFMQAVFSCANSDGGPVSQVEFRPVNKCRPIFLCRVGQPIFLC